MPGLRQEGQGVVLVLNGDCEGGVLEAPSHMGWAAGSTTA